MTEMPTGDPVTAALRALAAEEPSHGVSDTVRRRLVNEVRRVRRARRRSLLTIWLMTAGLVVATALPIWHLAEMNRQDSWSATSQVPVQSDGEVVTAFFPLPYSTVPMSSGRLVRLPVAEAALLAFGLEQAQGRSGLVIAEVLVGDDGLARAVRFVRPVRFDNRKESQ
jgi:hypothetical protein